MFECRGNVSVTGRCANRGTLLSSMRRHASMEKFAVLVSVD